MTDWPGIIVSLGTFAVSLASAYAAITAARSSTNNRTAIVEVKAVADEALTVSKKTEVNTNSMSERLERAAHLAGQLQGGADERAKVAGLAAAEEKGRASGATTIQADQIVTDKIVTKSG